MMIVEEISGWKHLKCDCAQIETRRRMRANGALAWVVQCLTCGRELKQIKKEGSQPLNPFDETLITTWERKLRLFHKLQSEQRAEAREKEQREWWENYSAYLKTSKWLEKRKLVLARDKGICQGCLRKPATQVHHLTYEHVFNEFLFELTSVCDTCHRRIHPR